MPVDLVVGNGLSVSNVSSAGGFTGVGGLTFREGVEDAAGALRLAAAMQAGCLVLYPGARNNHTTRHAFRLLRMAIDDLLPLAEDCEVPLALEPMHAREGSLQYEHETSAGADVIAAAGAGAATALAAPPAAPGSFAQAPAVNEHKDLGRNDPCWCGSGKKYKKCHGA